MTVARKYSCVPGGHRLKSWVPRQSHSKTTGIDNMPYYYLKCSEAGCGESVYLGQTDPTPGNYGCCRNGHPISLGTTYRVSCMRTGCSGSLVLSVQLGATQNVPCQSCNQTIYAATRYELKCSCGKTVSISRKPGANQVANCSCGRTHESTANWRTLHPCTQTPIAGAQKVSRDTEYDTLRKAGLDLDGSIFKQGQRLRELGDEFSDVSAGICEGNCLHWIRRVLQRGRTNYDTSGTSDAATKANQTRAAANIQRMLPQHQQRYNRGEWQKFARLADAQLARDKRRRSSIHRTFANLEFAGYQAQREQSLDTFLTEAFRQLIREAGPTAVMLSVGVRGNGEDHQTAISGHAIAITKLPGGGYRLFDPNYGVFEASSSSKLREGTEKLIGEVWTSYGKSPWELTGTYGYTRFRTSESIEATSTSSSLAGANNEVRSRAAKGETEIHERRLRRPSIGGELPSRSGMPRTTSTHPVSRRPESAARQPTRRSTVSTTSTRRPTTTRTPAVATPASPMPSRVDAGGNSSAAKPGKLNMGKFENIFGAQ